MTAAERGVPALPSHGPRSLSRPAIYPPGKSRRGPSEAGFLSPGGPRAQAARAAGPASRPLVMRDTTPAVFSPLFVTARRTCATWAAPANPGPGRPSFLESSKVSNVPLYEHFGYAVTGKSEVPDGAPVLTRCGGTQRPAHLSDKQDRVRAQTLGQRTCDQTASIGLPWSSRRTEATSTPSRPSTRVPLLTG